ncbi:hypothetical protein D3C73_1631470 [compost metagenome]
MAIVIVVAKIGVSPKVVRTWIVLFKIRVDDSLGLQKGNHSDHQRNRSDQPETDKEQPSDHCQFGNQKAPANK